MKHLTDEQMHDLFIKGCQWVRFKSAVRKVLRWPLYILSIIAMIVVIAIFVICVIAAFYFFFKYWQVIVSIIATIAAFFLMLYSIRLIVKPGYKEFDEMP